MADDAKETTEKKTVTILEAFLKRSGYKAADVDTHNPKTRVFATTNGGKYHLSKSGDIRTLHGPPYPKFQPE